MYNQINLGVLEKNEIIGLGIRSWLEEYKDINLREAVNDSKKISERFLSGLDVLLVGLHTVADTFWITQLLAQCGRYDVKIVAYCAEAKNLAIGRTAMEAGAAAIVPPVQQELHAAIVHVKESGFYGNAFLMEVLGHSSKRQGVLASFTENEILVIRGICQEKTTKEIAAGLCLSPRTIETVRSDAIKKAEVRSIVGLALFGIRHGLAS